MVSFSSFSSVATLSLALLFAYFYWHRKNSLRGHSIALTHPNVPKFIKIRGQKKRLSRGDVYYTLSGSEKSKLLVFVHGINTPSWVFQEYQEMFNKQGYRVLSFDLYGRGFSSSPDVVYDDVLFVEQMEELLLALDIKNPFHLVGYSMGGAISTLYACKNPHMVDRLALIASAGTIKFNATQTIGWYLSRIPLVTDYLYQILARASFLKKVDRHFDDGEEEMKSNSRQGMLFQYDNNPGYALSILSSMKFFPLHGMEGKYKELNGLKKKVLLIWGDKDGIVSFENGKLINTLVESKLYVIKGKGHQIITQRTKECFDQILAHFEE